MTEEETKAAERKAEKKGSKKEGKKRAREESEPEVVEVEMPLRKKSERELDFVFKKWVAEKLELAEDRSERLERAVERIGQTLESVCGILRRMEEGVPGSEVGSEDEMETERTLRDGAEESEKADESEKKAEEKDKEAEDDVQMVE